MFEREYTELFAKLDQSLSLLVDQMLAINKQCDQIEKGMATMGKKIAQIERLMMPKGKVAK